MIRARLRIDFKQWNNSKMASKIRNYYFYDGCGLFFSINCRSCTSPKSLAMSRGNENLRMALRGLYLLDFWLIFNWFLTMMMMMIIIKIIIFQFFTAFSGFGSVTVESGMFFWCHSHSTMLRTASRRPVLVRILGCVHCVAFFLAGRAHRLWRRQSHDRQGSNAM